MAPMEARRLFEGDQRAMWHSDRLHQAKVVRIDCQVKYCRYTYTYTVVPIPILW